MKLERILPVIGWLPAYRRGDAGRDLVAAVLVTIMLIPQSLAYALLAGLPAQVGLYASILPLVLYSLFGSSSSLSVGPMAIVALMSAAVLTPLFASGSDEYITGAVILAFLSGLMLVTMGLLRLGFLANFLSHPVISGFISASALVIIASQVKHLLAVPAAGQNLVELAVSMVPHLGDTNTLSLLTGGGVLVFLLLARRFLPGVPGKIAPIVAVAATIFLTWWLGLDQRGLAVVGEIPSGLPALSLPPPDTALWRPLVMGALLISVVGFVESISIAQTLAARRRQRVDPNQELIALGAANLGAGVSSGMPVTGGLSRSVVNFDAGASTPASSFYAAVGITLATLTLTPMIAFLPKATLAAAIIVAVAGLIDLPAVKQTWRYSLTDFGAMLATIVLTLIHSVEVGIMAGVGLSIGLFLYRTSRPHSAVIGLVPGTEHFRNVERHKVALCPRATFLRIDESLYFANARFLEDRVMELVASQPDVTDLVLVCPAVNQIDASAMESLETINERLSDAGVRLHLSDVKGPVMDQLKGTALLQRLSGQVFFSAFDAWTALKALPDSV